MTLQEALNVLSDGGTLCNIGQFDPEAKRELEKLVRRDVIETWVDFQRFPYPKRCYRHYPERNRPLFTPNWR